MGGGANILGDGDPAEDGHPAEAALELRRQLVVAGTADEMPADLLDLAVSIAWLGKAVSRTATGRSYAERGVDPNTWQAIPDMAASDAALADAMDAALNSPPTKGMGPSLAALRSSVAFMGACAAVSEALRGGRGPDARRARLERLRTFLRISGRSGRSAARRKVAPAPDEAAPEASAVVSLDAARKRLRGS